MLHARTMYGLQQTTAILPVVYGYETWSVTLKEEHWLRTFKIGCLRR
jgi:hypothetical protein